MADHSLTDVPEQDHEAMRATSMQPLDDPDSARVQAAGGGNDLPGREHPDHPRHTSPVVPTHSGVHEPIPGEHDDTTAMRRQPGGMGGRFNGADLPANEHDPSLDDHVAAERAKEGGRTR